MFRKFLKLLAVVALAVGLAGCGKREAESIPIRIFCAAGLRVPVSKSAEKYHAEEGQPVQIQYAGSGTLLATIETTGGDVFLAADSSYTDLALERGLVEDIVPLASMRAGIGVAVGNPKGITNLNDLLNGELGVGIGSSKAASIGKLTEVVLRKNRIWEELQPKAIFPTVIELANAQKIGALDAVILWDAVAHQYPEIEFVSVPEFDAEPVEVTAGVMTASDRPEEALRFCRFLAESETARRIFEEEGFEPIEIP